MSNNTPVEVKRLSLPDIATSHNYPFSAMGDAQLRAVRQHYINLHTEKNPEEVVDIPYPTAIHLMMAEFCNWKKIPLLEQDQHLLDK